VITLMTLAAMYDHGLVAAPRGASGSNWTRRTSPRCGRPRSATSPIFPCRDSTRPSSRGASARQIRASPRQRAGSCTGSTLGQGWTWPATPREKWSSSTSTRRNCRR
jgi:hypothetical protein